MNRLPQVRNDFLAMLADLQAQDADSLRQRIVQCHSLRELWHARAEVFRLVGVAHSQAEADHRLALLSRHFPTRTRRSQQFRPARAP